MKIYFSKYQGTGNDFILLDNRSGSYDSLNLDQIRSLCNRRFGVGADGLIKINATKELDFEVDYYNADGSKSFCGNGARCAVKFCQSLGMNVSTTHFMAIDGEHTASLTDDRIVLGMADVVRYELVNDDYIIQTGSPHYVRFEKDVATADVTGIGREIRYSEAFREKGINVNLLEVLEPMHIRVRTYERGVEDETLSCGTGVTACALAYAYKSGLYGKQKITVEVQGGTLWVEFVRDENNYCHDVQLIGPALHVFEGSADV